jgi:deoxyribonuclease-2
MLSAKSDLSSTNVDWWFMYKLPKGCGPQGNKSLGDEYLYFQSGQKTALSLSRNKLGNGPQGALFNTLQQLFESQSPNVGWIHYNDEYPASMQMSDFPPNVPAKFYSQNARASDRGKPIDHGHNGHCKGTLAFDLDSDTAFWLSHSTPRIPGLHLDNDQAFFYPEYADQYAQTFICISLENVAAAQAIANVLQEQHQPQVFGCQLPSIIKEDSQHSELWQLAQGFLPPAYSEKYTEKHGKKAPADLTFKSKEGKSFRLLAKSGAWFDDFWIDLVGPTLEVDLRIETWRRLTKTAVLPTKDGKDIPDDYGKQDFITTYKAREYHHEFKDLGDKKIIDEITHVDLQMLKDHQGNMLSDYHWSYTKDHAKWAISEEIIERGKTDNETDIPTHISWVCIADMNRMTSQEKRGGGAICFHEPLLWQSLNEIERISGKIT